PKLTPVGAPAIVSLSTCWIAPEPLLLLWATQRAPLASTERPRGMSPVVENWLRGLPVRFQTCTRPLKPSETRSVEPLTATPYGVLKPLLFRQARVAVEPEMVYFEMKPPPLPLPMSPCSAT